MSNSIPSEESLVISLLNVRSLKLHSADIICDRFLPDSDILCLTETQIGLEQNNDIYKIEHTLNIFQISFNNDQHRYNSLAVCHRESNLDVLEYEHSSGFSIVKFKKSSFSNKVFLLLLLYQDSRLYLL